MKKKLIALVTAVVAIVPFTGVGTANAAVAGTLAFQCKAELSAFPTAAGSGRCRGTVGPAGITAGVAFGTSTTGPFVITGAGSFEASFTYSEGCVAGEPPLIGAAQGTATISGMTAVNNGSPTTASGTISFSWQRVGVTAAIVINGGTISFGDGASANIGTSAGTAAFVPLLQPNNTCPDGGPLEALVAGTAALAGV